MPDAPPFDLFYSSQAQEDIEHWRRTDKRVSQRIERLLYKARSREGEDGFLRVLRGFA